MMNIIVASIIASPTSKGGGPPAVCPVVVVGTGRYNPAMRLMREVRCWSARGAGAASTVNTWAGSGGDRFAMFWLLRAIVLGRVDPRTGYLCDIRTIDRWLRERIAPALCERVAGSPPETVGVAGAFSNVVNSGVGDPPRPLRAERLDLELSPYLRYAVMTDEPNLVRVTRAYEFSAAHRLHCPGFSDEENRRVFGKCSNPHGHGHNYVLEVTLRGAPDRATGVVMNLQSLDAIVNEMIVDRFDHKNLNVECDEFASLNPSVENIARVVFRCLHEALAPVDLHSVRVWETPKTCAECTADDLE